MSEILVDLEDSIIAMLSVEAKEKGCTLSCYVSSVIDNYLADKEHGKKITDRSR